MMPRRCALSGSRLEPVVAPVAIFILIFSWKTPLDTRQLAGGRRAARRKARQKRLTNRCIFLYNCGMGIRRTRHAVFDIKYHLVWIPKYRKHILVGEVAQYTKEVLQRVADEYGLWVDTM
jgi:hypothetical protein